MDEPLSALDSQTRELLMEDFIRLLADGAMGAVYVTHNLEEAVRLADRIVVLSRRPGRVREVVTIPMTRDERGDDRCARQAAGAAERVVVADPRGGDRCRARGPACLTARRRRIRNGTRAEPRPVEFRGARLYAERGPLLGLDRARAGDRALAAGRQRRLGQSAVPAAAFGDCGRDLQARDVGRALAARFGWSVMRIGTRLDPRHRRRRHRRLRDRAVDAGARRRHHLHLGAVSDSEDRAAAAADPVARDRRGAEDRDHCARRVLLDRDLGL